MAHENYSPNKDILLQSIGSAVNLQEASNDEQVKVALEDRQRAADAARAREYFRNKSYSVAHDPRYQEIREKFGRSIRSKAYQQFRAQQRTQAEDTGLPPVNVLKYTDATKLQARLVQDSRPLLRDDMPIE